MDDEICPHCGAKLILENEWVDGDYSEDFEFNCARCDKPIRLQTSTHQTFTVSKGGEAE